MTATSTAVPTDSDRLTALKFLAGGRDFDFISTVTGLPTDVVKDIAEHNGYPDRDRLTWSADLLTEEISDAARAALPHASTIPARAGQGATRPPSPRRPVEPAKVASPATEPVDALEQLLTEAASSTRKRTRDLGTRAAKAITVLRDERVERERNAAAAARNAEQARVRKEVADLERRLAELKRGLTKSTAVPPPVSATTGADAKTIRAWARANGVDCTPVGRVPRAVIDAYLAALAA